MSHFGDFQHHFQVSVGDYITLHPQYLGDVQLGHSNIFSRDGKILSNPIPRFTNPIYIYIYVYIYIYIYVYPNTSIFNIYPILIQYIPIYTPNIPNISNISNISNINIQYTQNIPKIYPIYFRKLSNHLFSIATFDARWRSVRLASPSSKSYHRQVRWFEKTPGGKATGKNPSCLSHLKHKRVGYVSENYLSERLVLACVGHFFTNEYWLNCH